MLYRYLCWRSDSGDILSSLIKVGVVVSEASRQPFLSYQGEVGCYGHSSMILYSNNKDSISYLVLLYTKVKGGERSETSLPSRKGQRLEQQGWWFRGSRRVISVPVS